MSLSELRSIASSSAELLGVARDKALVAVDILEGWVRQGRKIITAEELALAAGIPQRYAAQILASAVSTGMLEPVRHGAKNAVYRVIRDEQPLDLVEPPPVGRTVVGSVVVSLFYQAYRRNGFQDILLVGEKGNGKTTVALWIAAGLLQYIENVSVRDAFLKAYREHLVMGWGQLLEKLERIVGGERFPVLILDDISQFIGRYSQNSRLSEAFGRFFDVSRSAVSAMIYTTTTEANVPKYLRDQLVYKGYVTLSGDGRHSVVRYYEAKELPDKGRREWVRASVAEKFRLQWPVPGLYERYLEERHERQVAPSAERLITAIRETLGGGGDA